MNFDYTDDQKFLKNEARKFLEGNCSTAQVRKVLNDDGKAYDEALWKGVAAQGWLGAAIPEEHGGLGLGHIELCAIAEELGRAVAPIPFASTVSTGRPAGSELVVVRFPRASTNAVYRPPAR